MFTAISSGRTAERTFSLSELKLNGVLAAALAPDGSRVAVVVTKRSDGKTFDDLQIWDFRSQKLLSERRMKLSDSQLSQSTSRSLAYTPDGERLLYCDGAVVHTLNPNGVYDEVGTFPVTPDRNWQVRNMRISATGTKLAVRAIRLDRDFYLQGGVLLNVYSLPSGTLKSTQKIESVLDELGDSGMAWSPDGTRLAIIQEPTHEHVYAAGIQEVVAMFPDLRVQAESGGFQVRTGHWAGDVAFIGTDSIVTVARETAQGSDPGHKLRLWDAETGKFLREIASKPEGAHDHVEVSVNGRVLLAYVGKDRRSELFQSVTHQPRFRLWDTATWDVLFTSPVIPHSDNQFDSQEMQFALANDGNVVMVWDSVETASIYIYELNSMPTGRN